MEMFILDNFIIFNGGDITVGGQNQQQAQTQQPVPGQQVQEPGGIGLFNLLIIPLMILFMWLVIFRPQRKREKAIREMQNNLRTGDNVVTSGGLYGKIVGVGTDSFLVEFGENRGIKVWVRKFDISANKTPVTTPPPVAATATPIPTPPPAEVAKDESK